jgi:hypothetical protein
VPNGNFKRLVHVEFGEWLDFGPESGSDSRVSPVSGSGQCAEIRMKGVTAILALGAIKGVCG